MKPQHYSVLEKIPEEINYNEHRHNLRIDQTPTPRFMFGSENEEKREPSFHASGLTDATYQTRLRPPPAEDSESEKQQGAKEGCSKIGAIISMSDDNDWRELIALQSALQTLAECGVVLGSYTPPPMAITALCFSPSPRASLPCFFRMPKFQPLPDGLHV